MEKFTLSKQAFLLFIVLISVSFQKVLAANTCSNLDNAQLKKQMADLGRLEGSLFADPTNCAFPQMSADATTLDKGVTQKDIEKILQGNPLFSPTNNKTTDPKIIVTDLLNKAQSDAVKKKIETMRAQLSCKKVEIEYVSDGPGRNIMNFKRNFTSTLSAEDLMKYHKIDVSDYTKKGDKYLLKNTTKFESDVEKFIQARSRSDRPVFVCTERLSLEYDTNTPNAPGIDFSDSFATGLPVLNNEVAVKKKICSSIKNMKPKCVKTVNVSTSSDRRSNCDRSKNMINKNGENECPYVAGATLGRNDFEKLSRDRADKLEQIIASCGDPSLKGKISKDSSGARGDGSSGICPYDVINKDKYTIKIKPEYLKSGASVDDLNQNRYARVNIESTREPGCEGFGKQVTQTSTISIKCIRIQAKCVP
jgi:hypothetical protein